MRIPKELIRIFHAAVPEGEALLPAADVNEAAMRAGFFVEPEACTPSILQAMREMGANYNTTFYRDRHDVLERTRLEQLVDQLVHYASTYGTDFSGPVFTRNPEPAAMLYKSLTTVRAVSAREMFSLCLGLLDGPALKATSIEAACDFIDSYLKSAPEELDVSKVRNLEARSVLYNRLGLTPDDPADFLRLAVYACTGSGMLINSPEVLGPIVKFAGTSITCKRLFTEDLPRPTVEALAGIFFRYKHIFIAFKQSFRRASTHIPEAARGASLINYLRELAPRFKRPFRAGVLQRVLSPEVTDAEVEAAVKKEDSTYLLVRVLGYLRMAEARPEAALYVIRNEKTYIKACNQQPPIASERASRLAEIVEQEIVGRLGRRVGGKTVKFPESLKLAAPVSEKNFVGNIPFMSSCKLEGSSFVGVYWRNEWGAHDFDLSGVFPYENIKIGWNESFVNDDESVVYSGDMTSADPEASEILYFRSGAPDGFIFVNMYNGIYGSGYRLFFGLGEKTEVEESRYGGINFAVREADIRVEAEMKADSREQLVGYIDSGRFYFMTLGLGKGAVSHKAREFPLHEALASRRLSSVDLRTLLLKAGARDAAASGSEPDIDLSERALTRTSLIDLFKS